MARTAVLRPVLENKSDSAFLTISEVASELDVPQHVLRFWETRFAQIKPLKMRGGRRYYRPEDVALLQKIKTLLYSQGYTIKGAKKAIHSGAEVIDMTRDMQEAASSPAPAPQTEAIIEAPVPEDMVQVKKEQLQSILSELYEMRDMVKKFAKVA
jgi:DNA-binding transcriptional MerR regulator